MNKQKVHYLRVSMVRGKHRKIAIEEYRIDGFVAVEARCYETDEGMMSKERREGEKLLKRVRRKLSQYDFTECVYDLDDKLEKQLLTRRFIFEAKKRELLVARKEVVAHLAERENNVVGADASTFLLVVNSESWNWKEIACLLEEAKDLFEYLHIYCEDPLVKKRLVDFFYDEWGIVLHALKREQLRCFEAEAAIFLLSELEPGILNGAVYHKGYVITDETFSCKMNRTEWGRGTGKDMRQLYGGLVYTLREKEMPYRIGACVSEQKRILCDAFRISFVAIYALKW